MTILVLIAVVLGVIGVSADKPKGDADLELEGLAIGGVGGIYLLAEPGELVIEVEKRDKNTRNGVTNLRAILLGPDRRHLDEVVIPDDGKGKDDGFGETQTATLSTTVDKKGIYVLNVTVTHDRYGENVLWGFRTNCSKYLIETSRGHKDARHLEPIVLGNPDVSMDVCFTARSESIEIDVSDLPDASKPLSLFDGKGEPVAEIPVDKSGAASYAIPSGTRSSDPWRLHIPQGTATVHIDGVTRWGKGERSENLSLWSPSLNSFFPLNDLRWMMAPYHHAYHAEPGGQHQVVLRLHNNSARTDTFTLTAEESELGASLSATTVTMEPDEAKEVTATLSSPPSAEGGTLSTRIAVSSANHPKFTTWSSLEARIGQSSQLQLNGPLVYKPYEHENEQFAYTPDYPNDNQIYFSPDNQPFIRADDGVLRLGKEGWETVHTVDGKRYRGVTSKVAFGEKGIVCLIGRSEDGIAYLHSEDGGTTFTTTSVPAREGKRQQWDIEQFAGHNIPRSPAPFLRATETGEYDPANFWRHENDLELFLPQFIDGKVVIGEPILLATEAIGISSHSGIPSAIMSRDDRVHVVWGEATEPDGDEPGVPAYVVTYDRDAGKLLGEKAFVGFGPPANDVHNTPSIVIDSEGYLHTLTGTHGQPFAYAKSLEPNTAHAGFTEPELVEEELRSTYIGFVCDPDDTLHLVFRTWKTDGEYHPASHYANLAYKRKTKSGNWETMKRLAVAPFTEYSIWYHRLTIDRKGRLFVSFDYWSTFWFYRVDHFGNSAGRGQAGGGGRRKTIMSVDGGESWKLLETSDL
jgi:hypothetical protein